MKYTICKTCEHCKTDDDDAWECDLVPYEVRYSHITGKVLPHFMQRRIRSTYFKMPTNCPYKLEHILGGGDK